jgi:outer membrane protein OmpA-like peptidoglycan-associated protein
VDLTFEQPVCAAALWPAWLRWVVSGSLVLLAHGCATAPPSRPAVPASPSSAPAAAPATPRGSPAEVERRWLHEWFKGTPVRITQDGDDLVTVEVPREFCFDRGRSAVKPPLAAVLDKLAESLRRHPKARVQVLAASDDGAADPELAAQRAAQVRSHLQSRGVGSARLGRPTRTAAAVVQLQLNFDMR